MSQHYQSIIIGAGHNGLVCAAYLARAGNSVLVLDANGWLGGAASTQSFYPGFRLSRVAHLLHALPQNLISELQLHQHGLQFASSNMATYALSTQRLPLRLHNGHIENLPDEYAQDQVRYHAFVKQMNRFAAVIQSLNSKMPSRVIPATWRERLDLLRVGLKLRLLGRRDMREFLRIAGMNVYDLLEERFQSPELKGALALDATLGAEHGPRSPGTVLNYLHRWAGLRNAGSNGIAQVSGGMGALSEAVALSAKHAGTEIRLNTAVKRILVESDRAVGVELENGEQIYANQVVSNADPKTSYLNLLGPRHLDTEFVRRIKHYRCKGLTAKLHLALNSLPTFSQLPVAALSQRLIIAPSLDYVEQAFNPSKYGELPPEPVLEITLPSVADSSLAPCGQHVLSAIVQYVPYELREAPAEIKKQFVGQLLALLERYAPGISAQVIHAELLLPADLEQQFHLHGGHWHHGALTFDQFFFTRPIPGAAQYQSPVAGFYLCGAGNHPGGGVMGIAGQLAARRILANPLA